ncbi:methionine--tRNA ligase [Actinopolymorpha rutila]|uniref:methionine--tRNA ligase n=1 Tax=Actinopolymorpha rutila TaxID=446787 RepID=A0A852Z5D8_9ACTN|nr:methionine--tRNA ligase [Actinopolymorpha rutila]NYH87593.1 methionyl-tRNA synthetase [Actinopolymorpha rutila]
MSARPTLPAQPAPPPSNDPHRPRRFYVTTSIPYVNADPHLGFALELVQADVLARHRRLRGDQVRFQSGTDDNALKNVQAAERAGVPTQDFVDAHATAFERQREVLDLSYDDFLRTSRDPRHRPGAERLWRACADAGDLYRKHYEGLYCVGCEQFYAEDELADGLCPQHETRPQLVSEENWFFRLSRYQQQLLDLYASGRLRIEPAVRANEMRAFVEAGLTDFSISRSVARARGWGVPVPGDPSQVMYVWWDALGNYLTGLDYGDGPDAPAFRTWWRGEGAAETRRVHVVGKDILRFHAIYWPAMLLSAGLPLPTEILVHDFLTANGRKLSKSLGTVVDPVQLTEDYGTDALRWWLTARVPKVGDTDFTLDRLVDVANQDLAGGIGNLTQRVVSMVHRYRAGVVPVVSAVPDGPVDPERDDVRQDSAGTALLDEANALPDRIDEALAAFDLRAATRAVRAVVAQANRYVEDTTPWTLAKAERTGDPDAGRRLDVVLGVLTAAVRAIGAELAPFVPTLAERVLTQAGAPGERLPDPVAVFPRLEVQVSEEVRPEKGRAVPAR